jgi:hypothetical protein
MSRLKPRPTKRLEAEEDGLSEAFLMSRLR